MIDQYVVAHKFSHCTPTERHVLCQHKAVNAYVTVCREDVVKMVSRQVLTFQMVQLKFYSKMPCDELVTCLGRTPPVACCPSWDRHQASVILHEISSDK